MSLQAIDPGLDLRHAAWQDGAVGVFLVSIVEDSVVWHDLSEPRYFGEVVVSNRPVPGHAPWFVVSAIDRGCRVEWLASRPSELPSAAKSLDVEHGGVFDVGTSRFIVYLEDASAGSLEDAIVLLGGTSPEELRHAARRYLSLPAVSARWHAEFVEATGFVQCRDGKIPAIATCAIAPTESGHTLRFDVHVWAMSTETWLPERERHAFVWDLAGEELVRLAACATVLRHLPPQ